MYITDGFVFLHLPKTGGTWMRHAFDAADMKWTHHPSFNTIHLPAGYIPPEHEHKPAFVLVRNPWDWWVSHFNYTRQERLRKMPWDGTPWHNYLRYRNLRACVESDLSQSKILEAYLEHPRVQVRVLRMEDGMDKAFKAITGQDCPPLPSINTSERSPYREEYDASLELLVRQRESSIIEKYGYKF